MREGILFPKYLEGKKLLQLPNMNQFFLHLNLYKGLNELKWQVHYSPKILGKMRGMDEF